MKLFKRSLIALAVVLLLVPALTGCANGSSSIEKAERAKNEEAKIEAIESSLSAMFTSLFEQLTPDYVYALEAQGQLSGLISAPFDAEFLPMWQGFIDKHGNVVSAELQSVEKEGYEYNAYMVLEGEDGQLMRLTMKVDESGTPLSSKLEDYSNDDAETLGSKLATAGGNTISGILVVFFVLAFLCVLISLFKYVNVIGSKPKTSKAAPAAAPAPAAPAPAPVATPAAEMDNKELIAVIAAAIAASEGTSPDGFVVRSIKRLNNNKW